MKVIPALVLLVLAAYAGAQTPAAGTAPPPALGVAPQQLERTVLSGPAAPNEANLVRKVYERSGAALLWSARAEPTAQALQLIALLRNAADYGLRPDDYGDVLIATRAAALNAASTPDDWAGFDVLLTRAAVRLTIHLHYGRVSPQTVGFELAKSRDDLDVAAFVAGLPAAPNLKESMAAVEPHFEHYALLKAALAHYRQMAADPQLTRLPPYGAKSLRAGDAYAGAAALRRLLAAEGDLTAQPDTPAAPAGDAAQPLDPGLIEALKRYQSRHGLEPDGALGGATFKALTTPMAQRVRQIELTLERWRWLPAFDSPPIIVNIPEFKLFAFNTTSDSAASILQIPVIVVRPIRTSERRCSSAT